MSERRETIYDYIVLRNHIIKKMKIDMLDLSNEKSLENQLALLDKISSEFITHFEFLTKYHFEPNKQFLQLFYSKTKEWHERFPSKQDTLNLVQNQLNTSRIF